MENKTSLSLCSQQGPGNEVILSEDADNLLRPLQGWDLSDFFLSNVIIGQCVKIFVWEAFPDTVTGF